MGARAALIGQVMPVIFSPHLTRSRRNPHLTLFSKAKDSSPHQRLDRLHQLDSGQSPVETLMFVGEAFMIEA